MEKQSTNTISKKYYNLFTRDSNHSIPPPHVQQHDQDDGDRHRDDKKYYGVGDEDDKHDYSIWTISLKCHILTCTTSCNDLDGGTNIFQLFSLLYTSERTSIRGGLLAEFEYFLIGNPLEPSDEEVVQEYFNIMSSKGSAVWGGWPGGVNRLINIGWLDGWAGPVDSTSTTPLPPLVPGGPHLLELLPAAVIFHPNIFTLDRNDITSATSDP